MPQQKSRKILLYLFLFLIIGTLNNKNLNNIYFSKVNIIKISGLDEKNNLQLANSLNFLKISNIFFLNKNEIAVVINSNNLIEKYSVFKNYPSTLNIKVDKTKFLAALKKKGDNFFLGSNGKLIKIKNINEKIPFIFGDFKNKDFFELKKAIEETGFNYEEIKNLYSFQSGRWDIETKKGVLVKLPKKRIKKALEFAIDILERNNQINKIDLRQYNQIIIND